MPSTQTLAATQCAQELVPDAGDSSTTKSSDVDRAYGCCAAVKKWRLLAEKMELVLQQHSYSEDDILASMKRVEQRLDNLHTGHGVFQRIWSKCTASLPCRLYDSHSANGSSTKEAARNHTWCQATGKWQTGLWPVETCKASTASRNKC